MYYRVNGKIVNDSNSMTNKTFSLKDYWPVILLIILGLLGLLGLYMLRRKTKQQVGFRFY